ncbi:hypothetical protein ACGFIY_17505 [Micromonospora chersina]|uniref:hypothetical protein n=1 Tax=Micromonospora chersina TaxID=47854 RepID=UPI003715B3FC
MLLGGSQAAIVAGFVVISRGIGLHGTWQVLTAKAGVVAAGLAVAALPVSPLVAAVVLAAAWLAVVLVEQVTAGAVAPGSRSRPKGLAAADGGAAEGCHGRS